MSECGGYYCEPRLGHIDCGPNPACVFCGHSLRNHTAHATDAVGACGRGGCDCPQFFIFKEFRDDGWPYCPRCEEDELYSHLMLGWSDPDSRPTVQECIATGMTCYRCNWSLPAAKEGR